MTDLSLLASQALVYAFEMGVTSIADTVMDADEQAVAWSQLAAQDFIVNDPPLAGPATFELTAQGRTAARRIGHLVRSETAQVGLLQGLADGARSTLDVKVSPPWGDPFAESELAEAAAALREWAFIAGTGSGQTRHLVRASLTSLGRQALASEYGPQTFIERRTGGQQTVDARTYTQHAYGKGSVQQNGDHNLAHIDNSDGAAFDTILEFIEQVRSTERVDHSADDALDAQLDLAEEGVQSKDFNKIKAALMALPFIVMITFGEEIGHQLAEVPGALLQQLGV